MASQMLSVALAVESCVGMDDFFMPPFLVEPKVFPLSSDAGFSFELEAITTPATIPTLKYVLRPADTRKGAYLIWVQNYHLASAQACRKAIVGAIRDMANNRTLRMSQLDARAFI